MKVAGMRALVLHEGWEAPLYLTVELARLGIKVTLAGNGAPALLRRYTEAIVDTRDVPSCDAVDELLRSTPWDVVISTTEEFLFAVARSGAVPHDTVWPRMDSEALPILRDRRLVDRFVASLGVPTPRLFDLGGAPLADGIKAVGLPCIVRGTAGRAGSQVRVARDAAAAAAALTALTEISPSQPFLQEYVDGATILVGGLFDHGTCHQWFVAEKMDVHPSPFGPSVRVRSLHMPAAVDLSARIFAKLRFHGLGFAEYIVRPDGSPVFIEINPRPWGSVRAARSAGIDFLACAARQIAGHPPASSRPYPAGRNAALFPQYIAALISRGRMSRKDVPHIARALQAMPWREPILALHFLRELNWLRHRVR
jgi:hypothetical protein